MTTDVSGSDASSGVSNDHPLIALLTRDGRPVQTKVVLGFLGPSESPTHRRLYFDRELLSFVDVPAEGILLVESRPGAPLSEPAKVWVDAHAPLSWSAADPSMSDRPVFTIEDVVEGRSPEADAPEEQIEEPHALEDRGLQPLLDGDLVLKLFESADEDRAGRSLAATSWPCAISGLVCPTTDCFRTPSCTTGSVCTSTPKCEPSTPKCPSPPTMRWCTGSGPC